MPNLDHPTLPLIKEKFADRKLFATEFRGQTTLIIDKADFLEVMAFLRMDGRCQYDFLSDVTCVDYMDYPGAPGATEAGEGAPTGRFGVVYNLVSYPNNRRLFVKVMLDPTLDTSGIEDDPALHLPSLCGIWPGAEWTEREVFDMFGIRFDEHPDLRRILLWESYPAHPLRKDYPVIGRGEREEYVVVDRDSA
jgi:NADH-quinone oxidoreductase subunit C